MSEKNIRLAKEINFDELLKLAASMPMVRIERETFLKSALSKYCSDETVEEAIQYNPAYAGISLATIDKIAKASINYETSKVTALSAAAGIPGGFAMIGTIPADVTQYFGHVIRFLQKLVYLYGWQDLFDENGQMDDAMAGLITLFVGVMFGVSGAAGAVAKIADIAAKNVAKRLAQKALMKGTIYPIVKKVAFLLGVKMTREIFAKSVAKVVPLIGGVVSGGMTFATFRPMSEKLRRHLATLKFADVGYYKNIVDDENIVYAESVTVEPEIAEDDE